MCNIRPNCRIFTYQSAQAIRIFGLKHLGKPHPFIVKRFLEQPKGFSLVIQIFMFMRIQRQKKGYKFHDWVKRPLVRMTAFQTHEDSWHFSSELPSIDLKSGD